MDEEEKVAPPEASTGDREKMVAMLPPRFIEILAANGITHPEDVVKRLKNAVSLDIEGEMGDRGIEVVLTNDLALPDGVTSGDLPHQIKIHGSLRIGRENLSALAGHSIDVGNKIKVSVADGDPITLDEVEDLLDGLDGFSYNGVEIIREGGRASSSETASSDTDPWRPRPEISIGERGKMVAMLPPKFIEILAANGITRPEDVVVKSKKAFRVDAKDNGIEVTLTNDLTLPAGITSADLPSIINVYGSLEIRREDLSILTGHSIDVEHKVKVVVTDGDPMTQDEAEDLLDALDGFSYNEVEIVKK